MYEANSETEKRWAGVMEGCAINPKAQEKETQRLD
jgi:hypothetical protein